MNNGLSPFVRRKSDSDHFAALRHSRRLRLDTQSPDEYSSRRCRPCPSCFCEENLRPGKMSREPIVTIRLMTEDDLRAADRLRDVAGWNQRLSDWSRLLRYQPDGCFVAVANEQVAGTVTTTCYRDTPGEPSLAWIGMMLVHPGFRRQGIGTQLMNRALEFLEASHIGLHQAGRHTGRSSRLRAAGVSRRMAIPSLDETASRGIRTIIHELTATDVFRTRSSGVRRQPQALVADAGGGLTGSHGRFRFRDAATRIRSQLSWASHRVHG